MKVKFGEKLFQTTLSRLSHKVCRLLSSPVLLRKFTNIPLGRNNNNKKTCGEKEGGKVTTTRNNYG